MANIGEISEVVNCKEFTLEVGSDIYIMLEDLVVRVYRTETRDTPTEVGPLYSYGFGDNFMTFNLIITTPEIGDAAGSLNALTKIDTNGDMTSTAWKVVAKNVSGATKTLACTGVLRDYEIRKIPEGKVKIACFVRITGDSITIT